MDGVSISAVGTPSLPIPKLYVQAALDLLSVGANALSAKKLVKSTMKEDTITYLLSSEMTTAQRAGTSDIISWDFRVKSHDPTQPEVICELDFKFRWSEFPNDYERYLGAEAKRLFGSGASLAGDYVDDGVMDFVVGKYGRGHSYGIMLGYTLAAPVTTAISKVQAALKARGVKTCERSEFTPCDTLCQHRWTYHSSHFQACSGQNITLIHLFFDFT